MMQQSNAPSIASLVRPVAHQLFQFWLILKNLGLNLRPWKDFLNTSKLQPPQPNNAFQRVQANLLDYSGNYVVICLIIFLYGIVHTPLIILPIGFVLVAWSYLFVIRQTSLRIAGSEVTVGQKYAALTALGLILLFWTSGFTLFWVLGISASVILAHAAFRQNSLSDVALDSGYPTKLGFTDLRTPEGLDGQPIAITVIGDTVQTMDGAAQEEAMRDHYHQVKYDLNRNLDENDS